MKVLLTGAHGFIGRHIATKLQSAGHEVRAASRQTGIDFCHMTSIDNWMSHLGGIDAVINGAGIIQPSRKQSFTAIHHLAPAALFRACTLCHVKRVVQLSALGANAASASPFLQSKGAADATLREQDIDWFILRPSLVYGPGGASCQFFMRLAAMPLIPVIGDGRQCIQPVYVADVADAAVQCLTTTQTRIELDVVGSQVLTFSRWLSMMRKSQSLPPAGFLHIPIAAAMTIAHLAQHCSPMIQPDNLRMLLAGSTVDGNPFAQWLGRAPLHPSPELILQCTNTNKAGGRR